MDFDGSNVYQLAGNLGLPDLLLVVRQAGVMTVLQLTVYYAEQRLRHSVAQLIEYQWGDVALQVAYEGVKLSQPLQLPLERRRIDKLQAVLLELRFGKLRDQANLSYAERSLWLIQRAAGAHIHSVMLAPDRAELPYTRLVNAIDAYLPEAIREVPLR